MAAYRFYKLNESGRIFTAPVVADCRDDAEAFRRAQQLATDSTVEIWSGQRLVGLVQAGRPE